MPYLLTILLCVAADQAVKYYVVTHLALYESAPLLPGLVELYYIRNTGGGFSILSGHTWLLTLLTAAVLIQSFSQLVLRRNAVKDDEDSCETGPLVKLVLLACVIAALAVTAAAAVVLMGVRV